MQGVMVIVLKPAWKKGGDEGNFWELLGTDKWMSGFETNQKGEPN
jgi:hypothetical protein